MNIRFIFGLAVVYGLLVSSVFAMQPGDENGRKRKASEEQQDLVEDQLALIRRERQAQYQAYRQAQEEKERKAHEEQEQLQRAKQAEKIQKLQSEQTQFDALETLILTLMEFINELEYASNFDDVCGCLGTITDTLGESGFDFAELKQSSNELLAAKVMELFSGLHAIVTKIEANPIAQKACFKFQTINDQLSIICQIVGYEGGIAVELKDMYTEEDEQIAHGDYKQQEQVYTADDEDLARLLQDAQDDEVVGGDADLARLLEEEQSNQDFEADAQAARLLQEELDRDDA
ncbi:hypothetical protein JST56_04600 [Candidatus Dependentiae bacterium]|nr:hypothetical protein [Candidatus Dependentiae bacterium]